MYQNTEIEQLKRLVAARLSAYARKDAGLAMALVPGLQPEGEIGYLDKRLRMDILEQPLRDAVAEVLASQGQAARRVSPNQIVIEMLDDIVGLGPLEALLRDENVEDIYVFGHDRVLVKPPRSNRVRPAPVRFRSEEHLHNLIYRILAQVNRRLDESSPVVDTRLPDTDDRVNITIPPVSSGPWYITIRKHQEAWDWVKLIQEGTADFHTLALLALAVRGGLNILVSGATGAGKTTLLNVLARMIPPEERVVTIEDTEELRLEGEEGEPEMLRASLHGSEMDFDLRSRRNVVSLLTRPATPGQTGQFTVRDLVIVSLRLSPDRIIVGEVRGEEAFDMLQALNTGHDGSICTIHASQAEQAVARLRGMLRMSGLTGVGDSEIDEYIGRALHLVVHLRQQSDGARRIAEVAWLRLTPGAGGMEIKTAPLIQGRVGRGQGAGDQGGVVFHLARTESGQVILDDFLNSADVAERIDRMRRQGAGGVMDDVDLLISLARREADAGIKLDELRQLVALLNNDGQSDIEGRLGAVPEKLPLEALKRRETSENRLIKWLDDTEVAAGPDADFAAARRRRLTNGTLVLLAALRADRQAPAHAGALLRSEVGHEFFVPEAGAVTIGRFNRETGVAPDIDLDDIDPRLSVSRDHARLSFADGRFWLEDMGSKHGTRVNGERLLPRQKHSLSDHDLLTLGIVKLTFVLVGGE